MIKKEKGESGQVGKSGHCPLFLYNSFYYKEMRSGHEKPWRGTPLKKENHLQGE